MKAPRLKEEIKQLSDLQKKEKHLMKLPESNKHGVTNPYTYKCKLRAWKLETMYTHYFIIKHNLFKLELEKANEILKKVFGYGYDQDLFNKVVEKAIKHETEESTEEAVRAD